MNKELPSNENKSEEVDLIVFFNLIGNVFNKIFTFIASIFKFLFSIIIAIIKALVDSWKIILAVLILSATIGYFVEKTKPNVYFSEMLVEPYFESKYQLIADINYFNTLILGEDYKTLNEIFNANNDSDLNVESITGFNIDLGPETENDKIIQYQRFTQRLDSSSKEEFTYKEFIENRDIYSGNLFLITAYSKERDQFKKLEKGILSSFTKQFSKNQFEKKEQLRETQKQNLTAQLNETDSLKTFYINVRVNESKSNKSQIRLGDISLSNDIKSSTREFELLEKENKIRDALNTLEEQKIEKNKIYDVVSSFQSVGSVNSSILQRYSIIFPLLAFAVLCLIYTARKVIIFSKNYEG